MGFGEWLSGAGSAVDKFLGGTGGEPIPAGTQPQVSSDGYETIPSTPVVTQDVAAPIQSVVPENYTNINGADEQGTYRAVVTDTSTPATQSFVESYVDSAKTGSIDRIGYTRPEDIGDSKTQALVREGYSPLQATAMQREEKIAELVGKGYSREKAAESREVLYYTNEAKKAVDSIDAMSASKHHDAMKSGLPQGPNEFEHAGDLARQFGYKIEGVSNVPGTQKGDPLTIPFKGSFLEDANIITKTQRTGEMGDYKYLGKPFSSTLGTLDLVTQQDIGRRAAASGLASGKEGLGWKVDEHAMDKYTPELSKGAGFNLAYKEATFGDMGKVRGGTTGGTTIENIVAVASDKADKGKAYQVEMEDGSMVTRYESDLNPLANFFSPAKESPALTMGKDTVIKSPGITAGTINDYLLPEDRIITGEKSNFAVVIPGVTTEPKPTKSEVVVNTTQLAKVTKPYKAPIDILAGTSGKTIGGWSMEDSPLLNKAPSSYGKKYGQLTKLEQIQANQNVRIFRKSKLSKPTTKRKKSVEQPKQHIPKPDPKVLDLSFLNKNMTPVYMDENSFKFSKGISVDTKPSGVRAPVKSVIDISKFTLKSKKSSKKDKNLITIKLPKGNSNVAGNVNSILKNIADPIKAIKPVKIK